MITVLDKLSPSSVLVHTHLGETTHSPALVLYPKWLEVARSTAKDGNTDEARVPATSHETRPDNTALLASSRPFTVHNTIGWFTSGQLVHSGRSADATTLRTEGHDSLVAYWRKWQMVFLDNSSANLSSCSPCSDAFNWWSGHIQRYCSSLSSIVLPCWLITVM